MDKKTTIFFDKPSSKPKFGGFVIVAGAFGKALGGAWINRKIVILLQLTK